MKDLYDIADGIIDGALKIKKFQKKVALKRDAFAEKHLVYRKLRNLSDDAKMEILLCTAFAGSLLACGTGMVLDCKANVAKRQTENVQVIERESEPQNPEPVLQQEYERN